LAKFGKAAKGGGGFLKKLLGDLIRPAKKRLGRGADNVAKKADDVAKKADIPGPLRRADDDLLPPKKLETHYKGEHDPTVAGRWCAPKTVRKMDADELEAHRLFVRDGKLYKASDGTPFDTSAASTAHSGGGRAMFVMDQHGNLYASNKQVVGELHHSSFLGGGDVAGAGEIRVNGGVLDEMTRKSGHYKPSEFHNGNVIDELGRQGLPTGTVTRGAGF
jgi:hypothetical protein